MTSRPQLKKQIAEIKHEQGSGFYHCVILVNKLQLDVMRHNSHLLSNIGISIFWDISPDGSYDDIELYRRNIELTIDGNHD